MTLFLKTFLFKFATSDTADMSNVFCKFESCFVFLFQVNGDGRAHDKQVGGLAQWYIRVGFDQRSCSTLGSVSAWMGYRIRAGKLCRCVTSHNSAWPSLRG